MTNDLLESISQRGSAEEAPENIRIHEIANELRRCCQLYEAQLRNSKENVGRFEIEQRATELFAKSNNLWIPLDDIFDLGVPGPSGNENDLYVSNNLIYKFNNLLNYVILLMLKLKILGVLTATDLSKNPHQKNDVGYSD